MLGTTNASLIRSDMSSWLQLSTFESFRTSHCDFEIRAACLFLTT